MDFSQPVFQSAADSLADSLPLGTSRLNGVQSEAVLCTQGPLMLLAGAGSGKTKVIIAKINHLLESEVSPYSILALTFSNKAAKEMRERLVQASPSLGRRVTISTFHSFAASILRRFSSTPLSIYDDQDVLAQLKEMLGAHSTQKPAPLAAYIEQLKNLGHFVGDHTHKASWPAFLKGDEQALMQQKEYDFFLHYEKKLQQQQATDFSGLITQSIALMLEQPEALLTLQHRYRYIFIDEYQDTNRAQFQLLWLLAQRAEHLCVVGDEDQSIYSWRGADIRNILDFEFAFPDYQLMKLEQNYRSTQMIINAASAVIEYNQDRKGKKLWTANEKGTPIDVVYYRDDLLEASSVVSKIQELLRSGVSEQEVAIFYRSSATSRVVEDELRRRRLPYRVFSGLKFYDRREIKDLLSYLRLLVNPNDCLAFSRAISAPSRGLGAKSIEQLLLAHQDPMNRSSGLTFLASLQQSTVKLTKKAKLGLDSFLTLLQQAQDLLQTERPSRLLGFILDHSGYRQSLFEEKAQQGQERLQNIEQLYNAMIFYEEVAAQEQALGLSTGPSLQGFLESMALDQSSAQAENADAEPAAGISLMTIHAAKGLEFQYVFILGLDEGIFPSYQSTEQGRERLEEERRLFYVGMTRARRQLHLSHAKGRMLWGQVRFYAPSSFLEEIPAGYVNLISYKQVQVRSPSLQSSMQQEDWVQHQHSSPSLPPTSPSTPTAAWLIHETYGKGEVIAREGQGAQEKVTLRFGPGTIKKFMVKFAGLRVPSSHE